MKKNYGAGIIGVVILGALLIGGMDTEEKEVVTEPIEPPKDYTDVECRQLCNQNRYISGHAGTNVGNEINVQGCWCEPICQEEIDIENDVYLLGKCSDKNAIYEDKCPYKDGVGNVVVQYACVSNTCQKVTAECKSLEQCYSGVCGSGT